MIQLSEMPFEPRLVDPCWSLPGEVDGFRKSDDAMFHAMLENAHEALERGCIDCPDENYIDVAAEFDIVNRSVRQALLYHASPFATIEGRTEQLEHVSDMAEDLAIVAAELLHSPDGPDFTLAEQCRKVEIAAPLIDALCVAIEQSALISDVGEELVSRIVNLAWAAGAVSGDGELRKRAENAPPALRLANLELCHLAEPVARRLKMLIAAMLAHRQGKPAPRLASV